MAIQKTYDEENGSISFEGYIDLNNLRDLQEAINAIRLWHFQVLHEIYESANVGDTERVISIPQEDGSFTEVTISGDELTAFKIGLMAATEKFRTFPIKIISLPSEKDTLH